MWYCGLRNASKPALFTPSRSRGKTHLQKPRPSSSPSPATNNQYGTNNAASSYNSSSSCNNNPVLNVNISCSNHSDVDQRSNLVSSGPGFTSTSSPAQLQRIGSSKKKINRHSSSTGSSTGCSKNRKVGHSLTYGSIEKLSSSIIEPTRLDTRLLNAEKGGATLAGFCTTRAPRSTSTGSFV